MHKYEVQRPFYLRRDGKAMTITPEKLLLAYQKQQLRTGDLIRQSGEREWHEFVSIDWESVARICSQNLDKPIPDKPIPDKPAQTAPVAAQVTAPVESKAEGSSQVKDWWSEAPSDGKRTQEVKNFRLLGRLAILVGCSIAIGLVLFLNSRHPGVALSTASRSSQPIAESVVADSEIADAKIADSTSEPEHRQENATPGADLEPSSNTIANDNERAASDSRLESLENLPAVLPDSLAVQATTEVTGQAPGEKDKTNNDLAVTSESESIKSEKKIASESNRITSQFDKTELDSTAYGSKSAEIDAKSDIDNLFDLTAALLEFHVTTTKDLRESQQRFNDFHQSIGALESYFTETKATMANAVLVRNAGQLLVNQINEELRTYGVVGRDHMVKKRNGAMAEIQMLDAKIADALINSPVKKQEYVQKQGGLQGVKKHFKQLADSEDESVARLLADLDLYRDKPKLYHERLKVMTDTVVNNSPDVLVAYLLSGTAALALNDFETADKAIKEFRKQLELVPQSQKELRYKILVRYQSLGDLIDAMRCEQLDDNDGTFRLLQMIENRDPLFADAWLVHGVNAVKRGRFQDARSMFDRAIRHGKTDPRIHRVALQSLLGHEEVPVPILENLTRGLEDKAGASDWNSWYVLSTAYLQLGDTSKARAAFSRINPNSWNKAVVESLRQKIDSAVQ